MPHDADDDIDPAPAHEEPPVSTVPTDPDFDLFADVIPGPIGHFLPTSAPPLRVVEDDEGAATSGATSAGAGAGTGGAGAAVSVKTKMPPLAVQLFDAVRERYDLFRNEDGARYAVAKSGGHVAERISGEFVMKVAYAIGLGTGVANLTGPCKEASTRLVALASTEPMLNQHLRAARSADGGTIWVDLGQDGNTRCIEITRDGWMVREAPPEGVVFRRTSTVRALAEPVRGGSMEPLRELLGFDVAAGDSAEQAEEKHLLWSLVLGWLIAVPFADIARPHLLLTGEAGSAKTTRGLMLSGVWDPKPDGTLGSNFSKNLSDDQVKAYGSYVVCYDNLGKVTAEVSDHLARMSTGDLIEKRKLYSDADMVTINYRRTGVFTAISLGGVKPDVVDRLVKIRCERVPELGRRSERQMAREWARAAPEVLGGILDLVVEALRGLDAVMASGMALPRMADYHQVLTAVDATLGKAYWDAVSGAMTEIAKEDPLLVALSDWLTSVGGEWVGEPEELYTAFTDAKQMAVMSEGGHWPRDAAALSRQFTTHAEPLRKLGVHREIGRSGRARSVRLFRR